MDIRNSITTHLNSLEEDPIKRKQEFDRYVTLAVQNTHTQPQKALDISNQLYTWVKTGQPHGARQQLELADILLIQGDIYFSMGNHPNALEKFIQSYQIAEDSKDLNEIGIRLNKIGFTNTMLKNYAEALDFLFRALKIAQRSKNKVLEGQALNHIGYIYIDLSEPAKGLSYLQQSYDILETTDSTEELGKTMFSLCHAYLNTGKFDNALYFGKKALTHFRNTEKYYLFAEALIHVGLVYLAMERKLQAEEKFLDALTLAKQYQYPRETSIALNQLGRIQFEAQNDDDAEIKLLESLRLAEQINLTPTLQECHQLLSEIYAKQGNYQKAYEHHRQFHHLSEQLHQLDIRNRVKVLELSHNLETSRKVSEALKAQNYELRNEVRLRKRTQAKLEELSRKDPLTGLFNRRHFFELAEREFARSHRYNRPVSAIMIDLDHFKTVNDTHGHLVGDQILSQIGARILQNSREVDIVGRYGGEEFIILLPETTLEDAVTLANRIFNSLTQKPINTSSLMLPVAVSIGVSSCKNNKDFSLYELIDQADQALYRAKDLGRNRIEAYG
ncbi:diguanylate cyclase [bacterium]|nr:diguanylate cyclase [bacterium]MCB2179210.1 diguanylate cyclase [bacterium]